MDKERHIRAYIVENFLLGQDDGFDNAESLLERGVVDSTGVMELALFVEEAFRIKVDDEDFVPENLDSVRNIARFVERKLAGQSMGASDVIPGGNV
jgi:acyl carrier protein